jgi:hypothetical protein
MSHHYSPADSTGSFMDGREQSCLAHPGVARDNDVSRGGWGVESDELDKVGKLVAPADENATSAMQGCHVVHHRAPARHTVATFPSRLHDRVRT